MNRMLVKAPCGEIEGIRDRFGTRYLGIPYAMPPVGDLAFRDPVPIQKIWESAKRPVASQTFQTSERSGKQRLSKESEDSDGVFKAFRPGRNPLQPEGTWSLGDNSQDCLYLNVFVPDHEPGEVLPVMVWIYGGSWLTGGSGYRKDVEELEYDLGRFAEDSHTVAVSFSYRLGAYGFLDLHRFSDRFDQNVGLKDQVLALQWVRDNIAAFSGDPGNVTLFGQSAGAASILALLCVEEARPLFSGSILQSGNFKHFRTEEEAEKTAAQFLKLLHIPENRPERILETSEEDILAASKKASRMLYPRGDIRCFFCPVTGGTLLPGSPEKIFDISKPMLIGTVRDEADIIVRQTPKAVLPLVPFFLPVGPKIRKEIRESREKRGGTGNRKIGKNREQTAGEKDMTKKRKRTAYPRLVSFALTEWIYREPMRQVLSRMPGGMAWAYEYDLVLPLMASHGLGAFHATEIPVLFGWDAPEVFSGIEEKADRTGKAMRKIWGDFAGRGKASWDPYDRGKVLFHIGSQRQPGKSGCLLSKSGDAWQSGS